jgi:hypothetical protein
MTARSVRLWLWIPRILGIVVSLFIGMFALDAFARGEPMGQVLGEFVMHLIPAFILLAAVAASFRRAWIGGVTFTALAVIYAVTVPNWRVDWLLAISGPLMLVGVLFLWSWFHRSQVHA